jgi:hypothetical protein
MINRQTATSLFVYALIVASFLTIPASAEEYTATSIWSQLPAQDSGTKQGVPDFGQHCDNWCWAAASANSLWYWAKTGHTVVDEDGNTTHYVYPELLDNPGGPAGNREWEEIAPESTDPDNAAWYDRNDDRDGIEGDQRGYRKLLKRIAEAGGKKYCQFGDPGIAQHNFLIQQKVHARLKTRRESGKPGLTPSPYELPTYEKLVTELKRGEDVVLRLMTKTGDNEYQYHYVTMTSWDYKRTGSSDDRYYKLGYHDSFNVINDENGNPQGQPDHHRNTTGEVDEVTVTLLKDEQGNPKCGGVGFQVVGADGKTTNYLVERAIITSPEDPPNNKSTPTRETATGEAQVQYATAGDSDSGIESLSVTGLSISGLNADGLHTDLGVAPMFADDPILGATIDIMDMTYLTHYEDEGYLFAGGRILVHDDAITFLEADLSLFTFDENATGDWLSAWGVLGDCIVNPDAGSAWLQSFDQNVIQPPDVLADLAINFNFDILAATNNFTESAAGTATVSLIGNVPEATTLGLFALAGLSVLFTRVRRTRTGCGGR